jgi:hypothetical protein
MYKVLPPGVVFVRKRSRELFPGFVRLLLLLFVSSSGGRGFGRLFFFSFNESPEAFSATGVVYGSFF